jgi:DNA-binding CsgD family transcriptional regulator
MENIALKKFDRIFQVIHSAHRFCDCDSYIKEILNNLSDCFKFDRSHIFLQNENASRPTYYLKNMDKKYIQQYMDYYYLKDPLKFVAGPASNPRLNLGPLHERGIVMWQNFLSYQSFISSEYYNDFLKPQKIFFEVMGYLQFEDSILGIIGMYRSRKSKAFCRNDLQRLKSLCSFITLGLNNIKIRNQFNLQTSILETLGHLSSGAVIIMDDEFNPIYLNHTAKEICKETGTNLSSGKNHRHPVPHVFLKDCNLLKERAEKRQGLEYLQPIRRVLRYKSDDFIVKSQLYEGAFPSAFETFFLIRIDPVNNGFELDQRKIQGLFNLTGRESEIVNYIARGEKNIDIAEKLHISELTVKTHIQNIFEKMNANSRSAVVFKIMKEI